ncbi:MAG: antitoxin VapB family protein [Nanoarchaeota archaeon]
MQNQISTIQLRDKVKQALDRLKQKSNESYEEVIVKLIEEKEKKDIKKLLKEQCIEMYDLDREIAKEWEGTLMDGLDKNEKW